MDDEVIRTPSDKRGETKARMVREALPASRSHRGGASPRQPSLWAERPAVDFAPAPEPLWGVYPRGFLEWALRLLGARPNEVLHVCSGRLPRDVGGVRVDIEARACPDVRADGRALPFRDEVFGAVLIDPPYSVEYAEGLYGTEYPRPSHLLREASRVLRPGGAIGFLHFLVPMPPPRTKLVGVHGITQGCGYHIRAFSVFRRDQATLFAVGIDR